MSVRTGGQAEHVHAVVVGSGFGGAVSAFRLAEAGQSVVVLERGRAYPPGSFPRSPAEMKKAFWDPSEGLYGMFDVWSFHGYESLVSSGLGGGSLIYANVLLRKDEHWFVQHDPLPDGGYETWPITRADLDPHYDAVESMLGATPYPFDAAPYRDTPKTNAMRASAARLGQGLDWRLPPLAVSFAPQPESSPAVGLPISDPYYGNLHGLPRRTCRLCGECDIGCNEGSKNTLDHTYLSAAKHHGADLRTRCEVRTIRPRIGGGFEIGYVHHDPAHEDEKLDTRSLPLRTIACDRLLLGAGTYGTTYLLLRNRASFPALGPTLGTRFSGNGDLLTFLLPRHGGTSARLEGSRGPVITSAIRVRDDLDGYQPDGGGRGFYIEDGGYPGFVDWLAAYGNVVGTGVRLARFGAGWVLARLTGSPDANLSAELSRALADGTLSSGSLPLLGMGRDVADGVMSLDPRDRRRLVVDWNTATSRAYFARVRSTMRAIAAELGTRYADNPAWFFRRIVTVHPLGGAPMGRDPLEGVCDGYGEVFGYPGLHVVDGAAMPGPVGANPSLTIAAFADRACSKILGRSRRATRPARTSS